jgi:hypothetical protein
MWQKIKGKFLSQPTDYIHSQVAVRHIVAWIIGGLIGLWLGLEVSILISDGIILILGGMIGWLIGGYIGRCIIQKTFRSMPKLTVSARTASTAIFGLLIGSIFGDFISVYTNTSRAIGAVAGMLIGIMAGGAIGTVSTKYALKKEK